MTSSRKKGLERRRPTAQPRARGTTDFRPDGGARGSTGVVVSLLKRPDGTVRVAFDDVGRGPDGAWSTTGFITSRDYPGAILDEMGIEPDELEQVGLAVLSRLIAFEQVGRNGG